MALFFQGEQIQPTQNPLGGEVGIRTNNVGGLEVAGSTQAYLGLSDQSQVFPAGRYRLAAIGTNVLLQLSTDTAALSNGAVPWVATPTTIATFPAGGGTTFPIPNNVVAAWGTTSQVGTVLRSTALGANTALAGVLVGTPVSQAVAATSWLLGNTTANGDIAFYGNLGGNSIQWLFYDTSASTIYLYSNGLAGLSFTSAAMTYSSAAGTANQSFLVSNTSNTAAQQDAIIEAAVGGTTTLGDPQFRLTIPGGTSYYFAADNSSTFDSLFIGSGTSVGSAALEQFTQAGAFTTAVTHWVLYNSTLTDTNTGNNVVRVAAFPALALTGDGTNITSTSWNLYNFQGAAIATSAGTPTHTAIKTLLVTASSAAANVTITDSMAMRVNDAASGAGTTTNQEGLYVAALTRGTNNYSIWIDAPTGTIHEAIHIGGGAYNQTVTETTGVGLQLSGTALTSGQMANITLSGSSAAATAANTGSLLTLASTATGFTGATQRLLGIFSSGANANASVVMTGATISVVNSGTTNTNIALTLTASGGSTANTALNVTAGLSSLQALTAAGNVIFSGLAAAGAGTALVIDGGFNVIPLASSLAFKKDVADLRDSARILRLRPVSFRWNAQSSTPDQADLGLIAEEVWEIYPELVQLRDGLPYSVKYSQLVVPLLVQVQSHAERIAAIEQELAQLKGQEA